MEINDLILFGLSFLGSFVGVNFGGSMLLVMPALLGLGFEPILILCSTRPAIIMQSLIGLKIFKKHNDLSKTQNSILFFSSIAGALMGVSLISFLTKEKAIIVMLTVIVILSILASLNFFLIKFFRKNEGYFLENNSKLISFFLTGFLPAIIGGIVGSGAGLIVVLFSLGLLRKSVLSTSYLEKNVSLGHSLTVLIWSLFYGRFDFRIGLIVFLGVAIGAYFGGKLSMKLNVHWMYFIIILLSFFVLFKNFM